MIGYHELVTKISLLSVVSILTSHGDHSFFFEFFITATASGQLGSCYSDSQCIASSLVSTTLTREECCNRPVTGGVAFQEDGSQSCVACPLSK